MGPGLFRFFLASVVVIVHYSSLSIGGAAVYLFFALSGYWVSKMWEAKYSKMQSPILTFLISRGWRIAPVFLFCSLMALLISVLLPSLFKIGIPPTALSTKNLISSFILLGYNFEPHGPLGPAWSLDVEIQFYLLAPIILLLMRKRPIAITVILLLLGYTSEVVFGEALVVTYLPMFLIGMLAAQYPEYLRGREKMIVSAVLTTFILLLFAAIPALRPVLLGGAHPGDLFIFNRTLNVAIALAAIPFALNTVFNNSNKLDKLLSDMSYSLYLFHWIPILIIKYYLPWLATQPFAPRTVVTAGIIAFTYLASLIITICIDRPSSKMRSKFVQGSTISVTSAYTKKPSPTFD